MKITFSPLILLSPINFLFNISHKLVSQNYGLFDVVGKLKIRFKLLKYLTASKSSILSTGCVLMSGLPFRLYLFFSNIKIGAHPLAIVICLLVYLIESFIITVGMAMSVHLITIFVPYGAHPDHRQFVPGGYLPG